MATTYEIEKILKKIRSERAKCVMRMADFIASETLFKKFKNEKNECMAKIEMLDEIEIWLLTELRRANLMEEIEP